MADPGVGGGLPPDYDRLPVGEILARVRDLDRESVRAVRAHEREHAARPAVLMALAARAEELDGAGEGRPDDARGS